MSAVWRAAIPVQTRRLVLREPAFGDVARVERYAGDQAVATMLAAVPLPFTEAHASAFIGDLLASNLAGGGLGLAVARAKAPSDLIGVVTFAGSGSSADIGWWFGRPHWGKGFASEAVAAMIDLAFTDPALETLTAGAFTDNPASLRVQEKLGFERLGESRKQSLARGALVPHIDNKLTRATWLSKQAQARPGA